MKNLLILLIALSAWSSGLRAQFAVPERLPGTTEMRLFGMGEYENLGESIYIGALYIPQLDSNIRPGSSMRMDMAIVAESLSARRFTQLWLDAITLGSSREERVALAAPMQQFGRLFQESLIRGDKVSFVYFASAGLTVVIIDDVRIGEIDGADFFGILLESWIGDTPFSSQLTSGILGKVEADKRVQIRRQFSEFIYTRERQREIERIYAPDAGHGATADESEVAEDNSADKMQSSEIDSSAARSTGEAGHNEDSATDQQNITPALLAARLQEQRAARVEAEKAARLDQSRLDLLEAQRLARIEEASRLEAENQAQAEREEQERLAAAQAKFEAEQKLLAASYRSTLLKWLAMYVEYPSRALEKGDHGRVELAVSADRRGEIVSKEILASSGNSALDHAALQMLQRGSPLPPMPDELAGETFSFTMPVNFSL